MSAGEADAAQSFEPHRPRLVRVAYRMLGSMADAEDVVQDAFLRWHDTDRASVANAGAYLTRVTTRLCLEVLKESQRRRETCRSTPPRRPASIPRTRRRSARPG